MMNRFAFSSLFLAITTACAQSAGPSGPPGPQGPEGSVRDVLKAGSRLVVTEKTWTGEDGSSYAPAPSLFHDTAFDVDCSPRYADDGALRCLPGVELVAQSHVFEDSACTIPAYYHSCAVDTPTYGLQDITASQCLFSQPRAYRVVELGEPVLAIYTDGGGSCVLSSVQPPLPLIQYVHVESGVAASEFVRFEMR